MTLSARLALAAAATAAMAVAVVPTRAAAGGSIKSAVTTLVRSRVRGERSMVHVTRDRTSSDAASADPIATMVDGQGVLTPEAEREANVSDAELRELYRLMAVVRRLDQEGINLQRQGELGLWGPISGHEAIQVGAAKAMAATDWIFPYYRDFGMAVTRGIDPGSALTWFRGLNH